MKDNGLIFGAGYLGTRISEYFEYELSKINILKTDLIASCLDVKKPTVVINAAAKTGKPNVDWCEKNKEETIHVNVIGAINLCIECVKRNIYFVHLGSGCIYRGNNNGAGYSEEDPPNFYGAQVYADSKILSEKIIKEFPNCLLLRMGISIDDKPHERNFIDKARKYSRLFNIQISMMTVPHMLPILKTMIEKRMTGIYNFVNPGTISVAEIMKMYKEIVDPNYNFSICPPEEVRETTEVERANCYLRTDKLRSKGLQFPEIHEAVRECLFNYKAN